MNLHKHLLNILKNLTTVFFRKYKPIDYWQKRGVTYKNKFVHDNVLKAQEDFILNYLKNLSFTSVLEFGCGFGRIAKLILDNFSIDTYKAFDLSIDQINNAKKLCVNYNVDFQVSTIDDFVDKKKYDLVIGCKVLLHIPPADIKNAIEKLSSFSNSNMINIDFYEDKPSTKLAKHVFLHQYDTIYRNLPNVNSVNQIECGEKQSLFHTNFK